MEDGATEVEVEVAEAAFQILNCVLCKSAWLPDDLQMLSIQKLGKNSPKIITETQLLVFSAES